MKTYRIPCTWQMCGEYRIDAESKEQAIKIANEELTNALEMLDEEMDLPVNYGYMEGTFKIDLDDISEEEPRPTTMRRRKNND